MKNELPIEIIRFKEIRESHSHTQQSFAALLGIKNSTADIERGKSKISGSILVELMDQFNINPLWLYGKSEQKILRSEEHTSELQSRENLVCRLLLEKKKNK